MTVCIAAVCENGEKIVVAADRMYTSPSPVNIEFESSVSKLEELNDNAVLLGSGNLAVITEIVRKTKEAITAAKAGPKFSIIDQVRKVYEEVRLEKAYEQIVAPMLGKEFSDLSKSKGATIPSYLASQKEIFQAIVMQQQQFNLMTELLIAEVDDNDAQIAVVTHPAVSYILDKLGYGSTGSGAIHAISSLNLIGQKRDLSLYNTLYNVYRAKKVSEVAPGVGKATDIAVIRKGEKIFHCDEEVFKALEKTLQGAETKNEININLIKEIYDRRSKSQ
ncbi:MAG: hypothetical protein QXV17_11145 [Candidatus Micrarchaeaceae archaeon]